MSFELIKSEIFSKKVGKLLKKHPEFIPLFRDVLTKLKENPNLSTLKTHKLKGKLKDSYACSLNYEYRIIFKIIYNYRSDEFTGNAIFLETIGTHDEVY